jgi:hypothetical protein
VELDDPKLRVFVGELQRRIKEACEPDLREGSEVTESTCGDDANDSQGAEDAGACLRVRSFEIFSLNFFLKTFSLQSRAKFLFLQISDKIAKFSLSDLFLGTTGLNVDKRYLQLLV